MTGQRWPHCDGLHLVLSSLGAAIADLTGVRVLRAEDASGGFSLWPGHADFLTVLGVGVLSWRRNDDPSWRYCAVRGGVLTLHGGCELAITAREAVVSDDLDRLENEVLAQFAQHQQAEDETRRRTRELEVRALRELIGPLRPADRRPGVWP